jgi:hypothetical protein
MAGGTVLDYTISHQLQKYDTAALNYFAVAYYFVTVVVACCSNQRLVGKSSQSIHQ